MSMIDRAVSLAAQAHKDQKDKAGKPYILHVLRVAMNFAASDEMFAGAVLHDTVEDTFDSENPVTIQRIHDEFGEEVAGLVTTLTRRKAGMQAFIPFEETEDKVTFFTVSEDESYDAYLKRIKASPAATAIKIADLNDNLDPLRVIAVPKNKRPVNVVRYVDALRYLSGNL